MASPSAKPAKPHHGQGQLRIIAGEWRSRRLSFPDAPGLRPTPDRVRETLFNWLAPYIEGAKVLDAYTGSGALYLEALSRGAAESVALDSNPAAIASLRQNLETLRCPRGQVIQTDAQRYLQGEPKLAFDLVFLDPPFNQGLLPTTCALLEERQWLAESAWIYTESETPPSTLQLPGNWRLHREKKAGQVYYALWQRG
ncbi:MULTISPECIES: 16S rRNA (guanine(966)-N(2))-methyltransferase RsmD [Pseudomonas]|uniref:Ribosomal RNA small subunit methyltransferase D n=1 Tax=Pseudomonas donghuensis TaxID=1163398 RepID=A0AAP0SF84_9PSED|nr:MULTISPECIES: 16S rRNA (guanine(966)-N(2))-methyltransferase RsmD [Pseudomonas]MDF9891173.1 16S rRNA (guanine966-N2)-methyltransferase [Pseudomonas vranovensis]KDN99318.1 16S rRNA (guanine(966)-N(2))-methyltransferase RsmD [Pseudomonas donghuensis]MBF4206210.1 16S rRNA (guanine(966)-N(2))-methyltransferase RsmD [Pseudomonas donghuensis]MBS7598862.1 16S rRNA (guanine(966)-N(2))-methyltransferase RsmD [Pseudomonas sp. RC2C2]MCP3750032.1 16S rRNA (guanine(966)-N(2))-methyltransferase RsmD [Pse